MSTEQRIYRGNLIQGLCRTVDLTRAASRDPLRWYALQNSAGHIFGPACEMLESESRTRNMSMESAYSDYRWTMVPEKGTR